MTKLMPARTEVPYHEICETGERIEIKYQRVVFSDGRSVGVGRADGRDGLFFKITSPIEGGRESVLRFRLSEEAAIVLRELLECEV